MTEFIQVDDIKNRSKENPSSHIRVGKERSLNSYPLSCGDFCGIVLCIKLTHTLQHKHTDNNNTAKYVGYLN